MCRWTKAMAMLVCLILVQGVRAQGSPAVPLPTESLRDFSKLLREVVVASLPPVLHHEQSNNWGQTASVPSIQGLKMVYVIRNHGNWMRTRAVAGPLAHHLELNVHDLKVSGDRFKFKVFVALPTTVEFEQQVWQNGLRIFSNYARARLRIKLEMAVETEIKLDEKAGTLPDVLVDIKVADARVSYDNFVLEHINGMGGDMARLAGEAGRVALQRWVPSVERHALDKGREAILKAGHSREFRINLARLAKLPSFKSK